jgi:hypothetical protein
MTNGQDKKPLSKKILGTGIAEELVHIRVASEKLRDELRNNGHLLKRINDAHDIRMNNKRVSSRNEGLQESALGLLEAAATNLADMPDAFCATMPSD